MEQAVSSILPNEAATEAATADSPVRGSDQSDPDGSLGRRNVPPATSDDWLDALAAKYPPRPRPRHQSRLSETSGVAFLNADAHGFGDAATTAWISQGSVNAPWKLVHRSVNPEKIAFLKMLGQTVREDIPEHLCVTTFNAYNQDELAREKGTVPRVLSRGRSLGIMATPRQPGPIRIPQEAHQWAGEAIRINQQSKLRRLILLFPQTEYTSREWPAAYWLDLAWYLRMKHNFGVIFMLKGAVDPATGRAADGRFQNSPRWISGHDWHKIAALMLRADLVIGNDSGPVNLAGTLGTRSLALMGPTNPAIFAHLRSVETISVSDKEMPCVTCHFQQPYRAACDQGCQALLKLHPETVYPKVMEMLGEGVARSFDGGTLRPFDEAEFRRQQQKREWELRKRARR